MSLRQSTALDHTLLIVNNIPGVDENSELHLSTHYGMPLPEALRNLYALTGVASQAFAFAHTYYSFKGNTTNESIFDDLVSEVMEQAFGSNPPSLFVELGWERSFPQGVRHAVSPGIYGYEHRRAGRVMVAPPRINVFSEFHWNDFYDEIGARNLATYRWQDHEITDDALLRGIVRVLQTQLGIIRLNKTMKGIPPNIETLLQHSVLQSKYYRRVALITWDGIQPIVQTLVDVDDYTGPTPCECGDFYCEDYPVCITTL